MAGMTIDQAPRATVINPTDKLPISQEDGLAKSITIYDLLHYYVASGGNPAAVNTLHVLTDAEYASLLSLISTPAANQSVAINLAQNAETVLTAKSIISVYEDVSGTNQVPTMTSHTTPSGVASASSEYTSSNVAWMAFDGTGNTNSWATPYLTTTTPQWLKYQFPIAKTIGSYTMNVYDGNGTPKTWTLEGSNNDTDWTVLDTRTNLTIVGMNTFTITNPDNYLYYKINVTLSASTNIIIKDLLLFDLAGYQVLIPGADYSTKKTNISGSQTLTIKRLKTGTKNHVIDYIA